MQKYCITFFLLLGLCLACMDMAKSDMLPFVLPWDDASPGPTDLSATIEKPAGSRGGVRVKNARLYAGKQRLRLFGVNFTAAACFPDHETADKTAARLAKFGFNAARLHFLDSTWGEPALIKYKTGNWQNWDTNALDRLDYFIAALNRNGVYVNLNLLVGRRFGVEDGVDPSINKLDWKAAHAIGFFHQAHLQAQQDYARKLLTHVNPYTNKTYAEEPGVALVEINNENGLIQTWLSGEFDNMPKVFASDLRGQWNKWLAGRYKNTAALRKAWKLKDKPLGNELLLNNSFEKGLDNWSVEQHEGAAVSAEAVDKTAILHVNKTGAASWHVQFNQANLHVRRGEIYTISFQAAADTNREISLCLMQAHAPWHSLSHSLPIRLKPEKQEFSCTVVAAVDADNARLNFGGMNQTNAVFRFSNISFKQGGCTALSENATIEAQTIPVLKTSEQHLFSDEMRHDWIEFLMATETEYWRAMNRFLKKDLLLKQPVIGTAMCNSTPGLMSEFDVVDSHFYWEHPRFPGKPWDKTNWIVRNISMADYPEQATVTRLAYQRVLGKPFMVSEYNHPAPNTHAAEGPLFIAAFGAMQDWDAIFFYTYAHTYANAKAEFIPDFFDIAPHPAVMANAVVASLMFRASGLEQRSKPAATVPLTPAQELALVAKAGRAWNLLPAGQMGINYMDALQQPVGLELAGSARFASRLFFKRTGVDDSGYALAWQKFKDKHGLFEFRSPKACGFVGRADDKTVDFGNGWSVSIGATSNEWCTFAVASLDGTSFLNNCRRALVVATGHVENTEMGWKNKERSTVGTDWGKAPSLVESVPAMLQIPCADNLPVLFPLNERGQRGEGIQFTRAGNGMAQVRIGPPHQTIWYEICR